MKVRARRVLPVVVAFVSVVVVLGLSATSVFAAAVTIKGGGAGSGEVTAVSPAHAGPPPPLACAIAAGVTTPNPCSFTFGATEIETITATPASGWAFSGWSNASGGLSNTCLGETNPCTVEALLAFTVTANFVQPPPLPGAHTEGASAVNFYSATLEGSVNPEGTALKSCKFEYGETTAYGHAVPCLQSTSSIGAGTSNVPVTGPTEVLEPDTTYHYRLVASNLGGVSRGEDRTFVTAAAVPEGCANEAMREEQGSTALLLPDCMALEMVSPPLKSDQSASPSGISANGERVLFSSTAPLAETTGVRTVGGGDPYVASRGAAGWVTASTESPTEYAKGWNGFGLAASFTPDFSRWLEIVSTSGQYQVGVGQAFQGGLGGVFLPLSPLFISPTGSLKALELIKEQVEAVSADHSHLYFAEGEKEATFVPGDPVPSGSVADDNVYVASLGSSGEPSLQLLARDANGKVWGGRCGVQMGGNRKANGEITRNQGVVSANGARVYFTTRAAQPQTGFCSEANKLRIMKRVETSEGPWISELLSSQCTRVSPACSTAEGSDFYQGASVDGSMVYFTTNRQLVNSDLDGSATECSNTTAVAGCDLYLYDSKLPAGQRLVQVSAGETNVQHEAGKEADVFNGVTAISGDGSHVYYVANGVVTEHPNAAGAVAQHGQPNLYVYDAETGETAFIATLSSGDAEKLWGGPGTPFQSQAYPVPLQGSNAKGEEVGGDGHVLVFESKASLTANDTDGGHNDVFRYDGGASPPTLECVSCRPGAPDSEPFDSEVEGAGGFGTDFAELRRWVSEDGGTVLFTTIEPLVPGDANGAADSYMWREGQFYRLPGGRAVLSHDGDEVAFQTISALLPQDGDNASDVYIARAGGGFPVPPVREACQGEACQGPFAAATAFGAPGSVAFSGSGNQPPPVSVTVVKTKSLTRAQKLSRALAACKKKPKKRRASCRASARKKYGPAKQKVKKNDKAKRSSNGKESK